MHFNDVFFEAIEMLKMLISTPSLSRDEKVVADMVEKKIGQMGFKPRRKGNNIWIVSPNFDETKPTILLNSHIDTVKPTGNWDTDPFTPTISDDMIIGLGSNDAGASVVSQLAAFRILTMREQPYNLIYSATAEEEVSGVNGVVSILPELGTIALGIVGEPTQMQMAVAEKGLLVVDGIVFGQSGHAARNEGINAIMQALPIIEWFRDYRFEKESSFLGPVKMTVTGITAGSQHNVIPDECKFMVDIRVNECYSNEEIFNHLKKHVTCQLVPRSTRLNSSAISETHPIVVKGKELGLTAFGSPTTSDQAQMPFTTIKIGPGYSARSHTANEFIYTEEIKQGIELYTKLLDGLQIIV
jgi:acetylornithine deacetylase